MKIAFYKGTKSGINGIYNKGVRWIEDGLYSHCEIIFSNGISASSSFMDGGVRFKDIQYDSDKWDIFEIPWANEERAYQYFVDRIGKPYSLRGNLHFLLGFIRGNSNGEFCSQVCAGAIGLERSWLYAPNALAHVITLVNEVHLNTLQLKERQHMNLNFAEQAGEGEDSGHGNEPPKKPPVTTPPPTTP